MLVSLYIQMNFQNLTEIRRLLYIWLNFETKTRNSPHKLFVLRSNNDSFQLFNDTGIYKSFAPKENNNYMVIATKNKYTKFLNSQLDGGTDGGTDRATLHQQP